MYLSSFTVLTSSHKQELSVIFCVFSDLCNPDDVYFLNKQKPVDLQLLSLIKHIYLQKTSTTTPFL